MPSHSGIKYFLSLALFVLGTSHALALDPAGWVGWGLEKASELTPLERVKFLTRYNFDAIFEKNLKLKTDKCVYTDNFLIKKQFPFSRLNSCVYLNILDSLSPDRSPNLLDVQMTSLLTHKTIEAQMVWEPNRFGITEGVRRLQALLKGDVRPQGSQSFIGTITLTIKDGLDLVDLFLNPTARQLRDYAGRITKIEMVFSPDIEDPKKETDIDVLLYADTSEPVYHLTVKTDLNPFVNPDNFNLNVEGE
jgi:hypothetical protein